MVDGAVFDDEHAYGVGIVIRNSEGDVIAAKAQKNLGRTYAHQFELLAVKEALNFAWSIGIRRITLEGDAKNVYSCLEEPSVDLSGNGTIIHDIILLASWFNRFKAYFVPRQCNRVVNTLCKYARHSDYVWLEDSLPCDIETLIALDLLFE